jgi:CBS domain containing-hemolysin-like protein
MATDPLRAEAAAGASSTLFYLLVLASIAVACFGAMLAAALLVYSPTKLARRFADDRARLQALRDAQPALVIAALAILILGTASAVAWAQAGVGPLPAWAALALTAAALVVVCGALPAALAATRAEAIVAHLWRPLDAVRLLLTPLLWPARAVASAILRALRIPEQPAEDPAEIAEDILDAVADHDRSNVLEAEEKTWIANIVDLKELSVSAIMTPRTDIVALPAEQILVEALQLITTTGHSRYPVHQGRVDEIVGLLYAKDVLAAAAAGETLTTRRVRDLMRKPLFVPETIGVADLLRQLKQAKVHLAVVLDEYGGTAGLITVEDILEEIVGDLADESGAPSDVQAERAIDVLDGHGVVEASGRSRIAEVNAACPGVDLPAHDDYDTIAGYLFSRLGRIPPVGESVSVDGVEFTVLRGDARRIDRLRLRVLAPERSDAPA